MPFRSKLAQDLWCRLVPLAELRAEGDRSSTAPAHLGEAERVQVRGAGRLRPRRKLSLKVALTRRVGHLPRMRAACVSHLVTPRTCTLRVAMKAHSTRCTCAWRYIGARLGDTQMCAWDVAAAAWRTWNPTGRWRSVEPAQSRALTLKTACRALQKPSC